MKVKDKGGDSFDTGKYIRYTPEQVDALERVYHECPKPSSIRRQQIVREHPVLANIEPRQIKVWFQNRRCREKQRKETSRLQSVNSSLTAMNKIIMEENERLTKHSSQLALENQCLRQQLQQLRTGGADPDKKTAAADRYNDQQSALALADRSPDSEVTGGVPQHLAITPQSPRDSSPAGLLSIAEETLNSFLAKATGTAVDWIQIPGMKPGPDSIGTAAISHGSAGIAARAWGLVELEPIRVAEILKDKPSWLWDCRRLEVLGTYPTPNGGTLELVHTQMYAPTTLAPARDFWTLRYTIFLEDRSLAVCERSLSGAHGKPAIKNGEFERAEMLPSGFLIKPFEGGVSRIHVVDHWDLESWRVLEVLRPLYESSVILAQRVTLGALHHLKRICQESSGEILQRGGQQPAALRAFSHRIARGFNDAVNSFSEDGWSSIVADGLDDVTISINTALGAKATGAQVDRFCGFGGILCAKSSMLLQNVPPATLIRFLREHRSEWAGVNISLDSVSTLKIGGYGSSRGSGDEECLFPELLEVIKMEGYGNGMLPKDTVLLQLCTGYEDTATGTCAQLVFAPVDPAVFTDLPLLPSGFRVIPLDSSLDMNGLSRTLDLTSTLEGGADGAKASDELSAMGSNVRSVLTMAFQFAFEAHNREEIIASARQYVRNVMVAVQSIAMALASFRMTPQQQGPKRQEAKIFALQIMRSYKASFGTEFCEAHPNSTDAFWHDKKAILCCTWKAIPEFIFANRAGLEMMETTWHDLHNLPYERTFDATGRETAFSDFAQVLHLGFAYLPGGIRLSSKGHPVTYDQAMAWKVFDDEGVVVCIAFMFTSWSVVG